MMKKAPDLSQSRWRDRQERFAAIFEAYHRHVLTYAMRRSISGADAQDIAALVFEVLWQKLDTLSSDMEPLPWLYGVARCCLANHRRRLLTQERYRGALNHEATLREQATPDESGDEEAQAIRHALSQLAPTDQEVLRLSAWEELSHAQIGSALSISENAVSIRIHRARKRLGEKLGDSFSSQET
tara:strand:- start:669 stop:1223 length:555 start_codon:yes stop_codon:yes gene_type:complete